MDQTTSRVEDAYDFLNAMGRACRNRNRLQYLQDSLFPDLDQVSIKESTGFEQVQDLSREGGNDDD